MDGFMVHCCKCDSGFEIDPDNVTCPKCATKTGGTQPTDVQQLKAKIAALEEKLADAINNCSWIEVRCVGDRLRQLSAV